MSAEVEKAAEIAECYRRWWKDECKVTDQLRAELRERDDELASLRLEVELLLREKENN